MKTNQQNLKILATCMIGTVLEWYDFALMGALASILAPLFFPQQNHTTALLATFSVFAIGFLARPIGGVIFGHFGDSFGRKKTLAFSILGMAVPTMMIGLLPTYHQIGIISALLLVLCRLTQGLAVSGEYPGMITYLVETAPDNKKCLFASFSLAGIVGGMLLGSGVSVACTSIFSSSQLYAWAWRMPFLFSLPLGILGFYFRYALQESSEFLLLKKHYKISKRPMIDCIKTQSVQLFYILGLFLLNNISFYIIFVYLQTFLVHSHKITLHQSLIINTSNMFILMCLLPVVGYLSKKISKQTLMLYSIMGILILSYPLFMVFGTGRLSLIFIFQCIFSILLAGFCAPLGYYTVMSFQTQQRYSGVGIVANTSASLFGGLAPLLATFIVRISGFKMAPCFLVIAAGIIALFSLYTMHRTHKKNGLLEAALIN